ncbi:hypothetical protein FOA52_003609 [Chlamydomonas sp. UWO 241]|nr:hypothetical protein FOA52_003609 [Chlamydomonas sp. UWO 241]
MRLVPPATTRPRFKPLELPASTSARALTTPTRRARLAPPSLARMIKSYFQKIADVGAAAADPTSDVTPSDWFLAPNFKEVTINANGASYAAWEVTLNFDPSNATDVNAAAAIRHTLTYGDELTTTVWGMGYLDTCNGNPTVSAPGDSPANNDEWRTVKNNGCSVNLSFKVSRDDTKPASNETADSGVRRVLTTVNQMVANTERPTDHPIHLLNATAIRSQQRTMAYNITMAIDMAFGSQVMANAWHQTTVLDVKVVLADGSTIRLSAVPHVHGSACNTSLGLVLVVPTETAQNPADLRSLINNVAETGLQVLLPVAPDVIRLPSGLGRR